MRGAVRGAEADAWSSKVSTWLINEAHTIWKARNEELHKPTSPDNQQIARAALELQARVCELYEQKDNVNYQDCDMFEIPLESRLQQSVSIMHAWVASTSKTLGICIDDFAAATARTNSNIRDHLPIRARIQPAPLLQPPPATTTAVAASAVAVAEANESTTAPVQAAADPEIHVLVDTSSSSSNNNDSDSDDSEMQRTRAAVLAHIGKHRRRGKGTAPTKQQRSKRQEITKDPTQDSGSDTAPESDKKTRNRP
jgi:hypothetical protein